jgi:hypothetical protein
MKSWTKKVCTVCVVAMLPLLTGCLETVQLALTHPVEGQAILGGYANGAASWGVWLAPYWQMLQGALGGG